MILYDKTEKQLGISISEITTKVSVVVMCDSCSSELIRNYGSYKYSENKNGGKFFCHSCSTKNDKFRAGCSKRAKDKWQDPSYQENNLKAVKSEEYRNKASENSRKTWQDENYKNTQNVLRRSPEFRSKVGKSIAKKWESEEYRSKMSTKLRERMIRQWQNEDYKSYMAEIQSENTVKLWQNGVFNGCFDEDFKIKMSEINGEILSRPEVLAKLSEAGKKNWENEDYRNAVISGNKEKWQDDAHKKKMAIIRSSQPRISSIQTALYKYLDDLGVNYHKEGKETAIGYFSFDCMIPSKPKNILIECQGDYWHDQPETIRNDKSKFTYINKYFPEYEIMYIWEHEFYAKDRVLDRLKTKLGISISHIEFNFKDVVIQEAESTEINDFLGSYHYIGKGRGGKVVAAYLNEQIIGCVVYSKPLRQNMTNEFGVDAFVELSRLCIHPSYHKKNFASWLISKSIDILKINDLIVAYADTTVGHVGTIYKAANFEEHHKVSPDYWYVDKDGYVMHKRTLYGRATKMKMTEGEFADKYGYHKKFGGEKICYVYNTYSKQK